MAKYNRTTGKVFGANANATGDNPEIGQFGSAKDGSYIGTSDISTIQDLPAWGQGWAGAVTPETNFPPLPEMTGAMKVLSEQICYLLQNGIAEWDSSTIYYQNNFVRKNSKIYFSLSDENRGNDPETSTENWERFGSGLGMPSNRYIDYTLEASGSTYTVPANGWVYARVGVGVGKYLQIYRLFNNSILYMAEEASYGTNIATIIMPMPKGEFSVLYNSLTDPNFKTLRFIYAEGEE